MINWLALVFEGETETDGKEDAVFETVHLIVFEKESDFESVGDGVGVNILD